MLKNKEKLYQIYHTMLSMALSWVLTLAINQYFQLKVPILLCTVFSFLPPWLIYVFDLYKKNAVGYLLAGSVIPLLVIVFWIKRFNPIQWIRNLTNWCFVYDGTEEKYMAQYAYFIIFAIGFIGVLLLYLLTKNQLAKIILAATIMVAMIILSVSKVEMNKAITGSSIFYIMTIIVELYGRIYSKREGKQDKREGILYLAPICLLLAVLSISLPSKAEPIQWNGVKYVYTFAKEQIESWKTELEYYFENSSSEFLVNFAGYSEDSAKLSKERGVVKNNRVALKITSSTTSSPIYLIGSVNDTYTGSSWEKSRQDYLTGETEYLLDYYELVYALARQDLELLQNNNYLNRVVLNVNYYNIKTKTFFHPLKTANYDILSGYKNVLAEPANIMFAKVRGKGTSYQSAFYEMNLKGDAFTQMLREADSFAYDKESSINRESAEWLQVNTFSNDDTNCLSADADVYGTLGMRAKMIESQYTKLPDKLPERVRELAEEITVDYDTSYDKLKAIEDYLWNYRYTLQPESVPEGKDFTDYFLFESKEGYCTSYATAMAVLGRCIGIPTRYVEGFIVTFKEKDNDDKYLVRNSQAHAWAEAYLEGVGWIPLEATASYTESRYTTWADPSKQGKDSAGLLEDNPYDQYRQDTPEGYNEVGLKTEEKEDSKDVVNGIVILLSAILLLIITITTYYNILKYRYWKAFHKADYSKKMYMLFLRILSLLKREGFELEQQETIWMLSMRVKDYFCFDRITFSVVATVFMQYRYAEMEITKQEFDLAAAFHKGLSEKQKAYHKKIWLWLEELFFLMKNRNH